VGCIFLSDIEERTALYYASLTGHSHIVEFYLSLYLISVIQVSETNIGAAYTFRKWFSIRRGMCKLKLAKNFTLKDYDVCILNALNDCVRHTLTRKKVTILDAMAILTKELNGDVYVKIFINTRIKVIKSDMDRITKFLRNKNKTKSKKPMLKYDPLNDAYEDDDLWTEEDYYVETTSNTECDVYVDTTMSSDEQVDTKDKSARDEIITNSNVGISSSNCIDQDFGISIVSSNIIDDEDFEEVEDIVKADSTADFSFLNCATSIDYSQISLEELHVDDAGEDEETTVGWDVVSDLQSVNSMGTSMTTAAASTDKAVLQPSTPYRDMLLKSGKLIARNGGTHNMKVTRATYPTVNSKRITKGNKNTAAILEENNQMNDAHWERDGFKNGRGGKIGKLFRGNGRAPKSYNNREYWLGIPSKLKQQRCLQNSCRKMVK